MTDKKRQYTLTTALGDKQAGSKITLTEEQAGRALYASRIRPVDGEGSVGGLSVDVNVDEIRAEVLKSLEADGKKIIDDAQAQAKKIIEAAQAEAMKLATGGKKS